MDQLPNGLVAFGPDANCTLELCPLEASILQYQPSLPANGAFIGIFAVAMIAHAVQGICMNRWGFMLSIISGCALEIIGYIGRIIIHNNPFDFSGFLMQIVCITVAPVFFCAAIYVLLSQVINRVDRSISRFDPRLFYWIFIPCDLVSLILQAVGGSLSCVAETNAAIQVGVDISLAGLVFQVVTLALFCGLFADYLITCSRTSTARKRLTRRMSVFLTFMFLSVLLILVRCAYRIEELHEGYFSPLFRNQPLFIGLESAVICAAVFCLNLGHPGLGFHQPKGTSNFGLDTLEKLAAFTMFWIGENSTAPKRWKRY